MAGKPANSTSRLSPTAPLWLRRPVLFALSMLVLLTLQGCLGYTDSDRPVIVKPVGVRPAKPPVVVVRPAVRPASAVAAKVPADWIPARWREDKKRWRGILIHHSATDVGNAARFHKYHKQIGWDGLGYHFVINNGKAGPDGKVEVGYRWREQLTGSHCRVIHRDDNYWNKHTIGICLVGDFNKYPPTEAQYRSLTALVRFLQDRYNIPSGKVMGHGDVPGETTECPGKYFSWWQLRRRLKQ